jgi:hypothetical protein
MAERKPFLLRVDAGLWAELEAWAQDELRSVNGQIEYLLREAVQRRRGRNLPASSGNESDDVIKKSSRRKSGLK